MFHRLMAIWQSDDDDPWLSLPWEGGPDGRTNADRYGNHYAPGMDSVDHGLQERATERWKARQERVGKLERQHSAAPAKLKRVG